MGDGDEGMGDGRWVMGNDEGVDSEGDEQSEMGRMGDEGDEQSEMGRMGHKGDGKWEMKKMGRPPHPPHTHTHTNTPPRR